MNINQYQPATTVAHSMHSNQTYAPQQPITGTFVSQAGFASQVGMPIAVRNNIPRNSAYSTTSSRNPATGKRQSKENQSSNICCCCSRNMEYAIISFFAWASIIEFIARFGTQIYIYTKVAEYHNTSKWQGWNGVFISSMVFNNIGFWFFELPVVLLNIASLCLITSRRIAPGSFQKKQFWRINLVYKANNIRMYYRLFQWFWGFIVGMVSVGMVVNRSMNRSAMQLMYFFGGMWPVEIGQTGLLGMYMGSMGGVGFAIFILYMIVYCGIALSIIKLHLSALRICKVKFEDRILNAEKFDGNNGSLLTNNALAHIPEGSAPAIPIQYGTMIEGNHNSEDIDDSATAFVYASPA